ncbi:hypothetical protein GWK47_005972 [Chionoecetes opilio]|uniref:Uncharacterized protein n=1 Tax=Chionoecetes opilio TaxID=41210 RepID=A0A8J4YFZ8_CHIOP|nr:hypothetical protein GWK47_005972 [Chionoecetes opilio]
MSTMDIEVDEESFPHLNPSTAGKRARAPSPSQEGPGKAPRTGPDTQPPAAECVPASFLLRAASGARVFANPSRVSHALHLSPFEKYILEGETRALGNGSALIGVVWEHNIPKVPDLGKTTFTLGEWGVTCRRAERDVPDYLYARVGPLADVTVLDEVRKAFRWWRGGRDHLDLAPQSAKIHHWEVVTPQGERDPSHEGVYLPICVLGAPLPPPSAPLPWVPSDRPLPQHLQVSGAVLPLQRASPMPV